MCCGERVGYRTREIFSPHIETKKEFERRLHGRRGGEAVQHSVSLPLLATDIEDEAVPMDGDGLSEIYSYEIRTTHSPARSLQSIRSCSQSWAVYG